MAVDARRICWQVCDDDVVFLSESRNSHQHIFASVLHIYFAHLSTSRRAAGDEGVSNESKLISDRTLLAKCVEIGVGRLADGTVGCVALG